MCVNLLCVPLLWCFIFVYLVRVPPPIPPSPPRGRLRPQVEEGCEGELVVCLPDVAVDPALYTPQLLFLQRPLEAPVSPAHSRTEARHAAQPAGGAPQASEALQHPLTHSHAPAPKERLTQPSTCVSPTLI